MPSPLEDPVSRIFLYCMFGLLGLLISLMFLLQGALFYIKLRYRLKFGKWPNFNMAAAKIHQQVKRNGRPDFGKVEIIEETP